MTRNALNRRAFIALSGIVLVCAPAQARQLSVGDYGIRPNSRRDQSSAFQQMFNDSARNGAIADVPAGRFVLGKINIPNNCIIRGAGQSTIFVGTNNGPIMSARHASRVILTDFAIDGATTKATSENQGVLDLRNVVNATISNVTINNGGSDGLYLERCGGTVEFGTYEDCARFGIFAVQSEGLSILSNNVRRCGNGGIIVQRWSNGVDRSIVARNKISHISATRGGLGQWGNGINIFQANNVHVTQNSVSNCAFSAIRMNSAYNTEIADNICLRSGETAIYAEFAYRDVRITGNLIDGGANGISATNLDDGGRGSLITNNRIKNLIAPGPYKPEAPFFGHGISVEADGIVRNNTIENANGYGINIGWGPYLENVEVADNLISNAKIGIGVSVAEGAGAARIFANKINAREGSIRAHRWADIAPDELLGAGSDAPLNVTVSGNTAL